MQNKLWSFGILSQTLPQVDDYDTQGAIMLLTQVLSYGQVYDREKLDEKKNIVDLLFTACMNPKEQLVDCKLCNKLLGEKGFESFCWFPLIPQELPIPLVFHLKTHLFFFWTSKPPRRCPKDLLEGRQLHDQRPAAAPFHGGHHLLGHGRGLARCFGCFWNSELGGFWWTQWNTPSKIPGFAWWILVGSKSFRFQISFFFFLKSFSMEFMCDSGQHQVSTRGFWGGICRQRILILVGERTSNEFRICQHFHQEIFIFIGMIYQISYFHWTNDDQPAIVPDAHWPMAFRALDSRPNAAASPLCKPRQRPDLVGADFYIVCCKSWQDPIVGEFCYVHYMTGQFCFSEFSRIWWWQENDTQ